MCWHRLYLLFHRLRLFVCLFARLSVLTQEKDLSPSFAFSYQTAVQFHLFFRRQLGFAHVFDVKIILCNSVHRFSSFQGKSDTYESFDCGLLCCRNDLRIWKIILPKATTLLYCSWALKCVHILLRSKTNFSRKNLWNYGKIPDDWQMLCQKFADYSIHFCIYKMTEVIATRAQWMGLTWSIVGIVTHTLNISFSK